MNFSYPINLSFLLFKFCYSVFISIRIETFYDSMKSIWEYHEATKHSWEKLYQDHHFLDWANQPSPFRTYLDCPKIDLGSSFEKIDAPLSRIWYRNHVKPRNESISLNTLSTLLYYSMAISAWKSYPGVEPWSLRVNPSSGDMYPTETHLYVHDVKDLSDGAYHYFVKAHQLERRAVGDIVPALWQILGGTSPTPPIIIGLNTIFWREAWKYQSRALRYCYLDLGHAMAAIRIAAHGLGLFVLFELSLNQDIAGVLQLLSALSVILTMRYRHLATGGIATCTMRQDLWGRPCTLALRQRGSMQPGSVHLLMTRFTPS